MRRVKLSALLLSLLCAFSFCHAAEHPARFPASLDSYGDAHLPLAAKLRHRATAQPLNLVATIIFGLAIVHTFLAPRIMHVAHRWRDVHRQRQEAQGPTPPPHKDAAQDVSFKAEVALIAIQPLS
jgi:hypothetical protein